MNCPLCDSKLERLQEGIYACKQCKILMRRIKNGWLRVVLGARSIHSPQARKLFYITKGKIEQR